MVPGRGEGSHVSPMTLMLINKQHHVHKHGEAVVKVTNLLVTLYSCTTVAKGLTNVCLQLF